MTSRDDDAALKLAMELASRDPVKKEQLQAMLEDQSWHEVAETAAYHAQMRSLNLDPWREPPCWQDEDDPRPKDRDAQRLLRRMLKAGVSRYHPDPMAALAATKKHHFL